MIFLFPTLAVVTSIALSQPSTSPSPNQPPAAQTPATQIPVTPASPPQAPPQTSTQASSQAPELAPVASPTAPSDPNAAPANPSPPDQAPAVAVAATAHQPSTAQPDVVVTTSSTAPSSPATPAEKPKLSDPIPTPIAEYLAGKGFRLATKDDRFSVTIRTRLQVRYDYDHRNDDDELEASGEPADKHLFQVRRARLQFQGNVFGKHNRYYMQLGFSPNDQLGGVMVADGSIRRSPLRDFRMEFDYLRDATVWVGQMKIPFGRQRVISSGNLNLVDRSLTNAEFQLDRDIGLQILSKDLFGWGHRLGYYAGVFGGQGRNAFEPTEMSVLYVARAEVRPFGKFDDYSEADLVRQKKPKLSLGAAYVFHDKARGTRSVHGRVFKDGGTVDYHHVTADAVLHWRGASLQAAYHWRKGTSRKNGGLVDAETMMPFATEMPHNGTGWFAQLGYILPTINLEFVGRYSNARKIFGKKSALNDQTADSDEAVFGINYFFFEHNLKLQADYSRVWMQNSAKTASDKFNDGRDRVRVQVQLAF